ncbi:MAG: phytoene desaturase [Bacteroidetes bacterium]|nr:MAG: phytoene desaturase [Bacteroidota bacterium]
MHIGIIGAGIAGLASAVRLAAAGHQVEVFEMAAGPGGKLSEFSLGPYRFDLGPSLFTMPQYVDELFRLAGEEPRDHFCYQRLPVVCHYHWEDGTRVLAYAAVEDFAREVEHQLAVPAARVQAMLRDAERKYQLTGRTFLEKSLHRLSTWADASVLKALLQVPRLDLFRSMHQVHEQQLQHPKLVQLFDRFATYNGSNPYRAPGLLTIIPHFEHHFGAYLPEGGMFDITRSIYALAQRLGVTFHFDTKVTQIIVEQGRASGLRVGGQSLAFDRIVSNMDVFFTYRQLLPEQPQPERILRQQKSTSALIFYWGIERRFPDLGVHNIFFSQNYQAEFATMEAGQMYEDPTIYINKTSDYVPGDAPHACENWFVMVNAPFDCGQDWSALSLATRQRTLAKLSRMLGQDIEPLIAQERILTPPLIQSETGSHLGALYGTSSNSKFAAFLRHPNFSRRIKGLYFVGGSVHPGGGIPLCLLSAKITAEEISKGN